MTYALPSTASLPGSPEDDHPVSAPSSDDDNVQVVLNFVSIGISIFCNFIIILTFLLVDKLKKFPFNLIYYMSMSCLIDDVIYLIGEIVVISQYDRGLCLAHGYFVSFFCLLSCTYSAGIAYAIILKTLSLSQEGNPVENREKYIHIASFFIASIFSAIPFFNDDVNVDGNACWIVDKDPSMTFLMQIASYYFIVWIEMFLVLFWFAKLVKFYKSYMTTEENRATMGEQFKAAKQLLFYPIIMLVLVLVKTVYRINLYFLNFDSINIGLTYFVSFLGNSQGTMDFMAFGMTGIIRNGLKEKIQYCFSTPIQNSTTVEEEHSAVENNNREVLFKNNRDDTWENIDKNKIEEEIKNSLG